MRLLIALCPLSPQTVGLKFSERENANFFCSPADQYNKYSRIIMLFQRGEYSSRLASLNVKTYSLKAGVGEVAYFR